MEELKIKVFYIVHYQMFKTLIFCVFILASSILFAEDTTTFDNGTYTRTYEKKGNSKKTQLMKMEKEKGTNKYKKIFQTSLKNMDLIDEFRELHISLAKQKYCKNNIYQKMKEKSLQIDFLYYQDKIFLTAFRLNETSCREANNFFNKVNYYK